MIKLRKISESALPVCRAANWDNFIAGEDNGDVSLPIEYELTGNIVSDVNVGQHLVIDRKTRNGVDCSGYFRSTTIKKITKQDNLKVIETENSVYLLEDLS